MSATTLVDWVFKSSNERDEFLRRNPATSAIVRVAEDLPLDGIPENSMLFIATSNVAYMNHGLHEFPAKFIPQIPKWAIRKYSKEGQTVLDPMCGSGTSLVEARLNSRSSYGIDIEPLACLISKVKGNPLDVEKLRREHHRLLDHVRNGARQDIAPPDFPNRDYWFRPEVTRSLAILKKKGIPFADLRPLRGSRFEQLIFKILEILKANGIFSGVTWNGKEGMYGLPQHSGSGQPDIIGTCDDHLYVVEATLLKGRAQWEKPEGASVPDHMREMNQQNPKKQVVGLFIASTLSDQVVRNLIDTGKRDKFPIVPIESDDFLGTVKSLEHGNPGLWIGFFNQLWKSQLSALSTKTK